jgi:hypothetical protein
MLIGYESTINAYRDRTAASAPYVLRRKKCPCGKEATVKQLNQYGKCVMCIRAAAAKGIA